MISVTLRGERNQSPEDDRFLLICCCQVVGSFCDPEQNVQRMLSPQTTPQQGRGFRRVLSWAAPLLPFCTIVGKLQELRGLQDCPPTLGTVEAVGKKGGRVGSWPIASAWMCSEQWLSTLVAHQNQLEL